MYTLLIAFTIQATSVGADQLQVKSIDKIVYSNAQLRALSCEVAKQYNIDCALFAAIITQESNWKIDAVNKRSSDYGLTQINTYTIKRYNFNKAKLLNDPVYAMHAGATVLSYFQSRYAHKESKWWVRYNCGTRRTKGAQCLSYYSKVSRYLVAAPQSVAQN